MSLADRLAALFEKSFQLDSGDFSPNLVPEDVMLWDSLGHMNLVMAMEDEFDVQFEVEEITEMTTAGKILEILEAKTAKDS